MDQTANDEIIQKTLGAVKSAGVGWWLFCATLVLFSVGLIGAAGFEAMREADPFNRPGYGPSTFLIVILTAGGVLIGLLALLVGSIAAQDGRKADWEFVLRTAGQIQGVEKQEIVTKLEGLVEINRRLNVVLKTTRGTLSVELGIEDGEALIALVMGRQERNDQAAQERDSSLGREHLHAGEEEHARE